MDFCVISNVNLRNVLQEILRTYWREGQRWAASTLCWVRGLSFTQDYLLENPWQFKQLKFYQVA